MMSYHLALFGDHWYGVSGDWKHLRPQWNKSLVIIICFFQMEMRDAVIINFDY